MKKKEYAIFDQHGKFILKRNFEEKDNLQYYLDKMYMQDKVYYAIHLSGSTKKMDHRKLQKLKIVLRKEKIHLNKSDIKQLNLLIKTLEEKPARYGMIIAGSFDTFLRELIPMDVWKAMGDTTL